MRLESNAGTAARRFIRSVPLCLLLAWTSSSLDPATCAQSASSARPELVLQLGHLAQVNSIAFTTDGRTIVTASDDRSIRLWDAQTGELLRVLTGHSGPVNRLALAPDGKTLASGGGDGTIRLWSVESWDTVQTLKPGMAVRALAFSPDRRLLAAGCAEANMQVDQLARGGVIRGDELFTFTGAVKVWNYLDGSLVRTLEVQGGVDAVDFLNRDTLLTNAHAEKLAVAWDTTTWRQRPLPAPHFGLEALSADGALAVVSASGDPQRPTSSELWDPRTLTRVGAFEDAVWGPAVFSHDGATLIAQGPAARGLPVLKVWDTATRRVVRTLPLATMEGSSTFGLSPDASLAAVSVGNPFDFRVEVRNLTTWALEHVLGTPSMMTDSAALSPDGRLLAVGSGTLEGYGLRIWDASEGRLARTLPKMTPFAFSRDGRMLVTSDQQPAVWDTASWTATQILPAALPIGMSPDARTLYALAPKEGDELPPMELQAYDVTSGKLLRTIAELQPGFVSGAVSPDGTQVAVGGMGVLRIVDSLTGRQTKAISYPQSLLLRVRFSPDGRGIAGLNVNPMAMTGGAKELRVWDVATGAVKATLAKSIGDFNFSPTGRVMADVTGEQISTDEVAAGEVRIWDTSTWSIARTVTGGRRWMVFSPDGRRMWTEGNGGAINLWDVGAGRLLLTLMLLPPKQGDTATEEWVAFTPEGYFDASPGAGPFIRFRSGNRLLPLAEGWEKFRQPAVVRRVLQTAADGGNIQR